MNALAEQFRAVVIAQLKWAGPLVTEQVLLRVATVAYPGRRSHWAKPVMPAWTTSPTYERCWAGSTANHGSCSISRTADVLNGDAAADTRCHVACATRPLSQQPPVVMAHPLFGQLRRLKKMEVPRAFALLDSIPTDRRRRLMPPSASSKAARRLAYRLSMTPLVRWSVSRRLTCRS